MAAPIVPWIGGKRRLVDLLLSRFPPHSCYVEVFAGGAAVFFARNPAEVEVLHRPSGRGAIEHLFNDPPDLLVVDHALADIPGLTLAAMVKSENVYRQLPVALVIAPYLGVAGEVILFSALATAGMPFILLIGAAPNAIAYNSKQFTTGEFLKFGIMASILLMVVLYVFVAFVWPMMGMEVFVPKVQ